MKVILAIYENGVFRPTEAVDLPERTEVENEARVVRKEAEPGATDDSNRELAAKRAKVYAILGERYHSGHFDTADRHNEHRP